MTDDALFNLRWDAQRSALLGSMAALYREEAFVDTTIVADNKIFKAHKLLLSASSCYLKQMLESVPPTQHAVIFMPHISASDLGNLLKFIYDGEIKINKRSLKSFLTIAKLLRIKGMDFELNEDVEVNIPQAYPQNLSSTLMPSPLLGNLNKRLASAETKLDDQMNGSPNAKIRADSRSTPPKENGFSYQSSGNASDDESRPIRPAPITTIGRSTDSISSQTSNTDKRASPVVLESSSNSNKKTEDVAKTGEEDLRDDNESQQETEDAPEENEDRDIALNLHIGRYNADNHTDSMDEGDGPAGDDHHLDERRGSGGSGLPNNDMDDGYDDDDDSFSMSIQPEVSIRESDESFSLNERRHSFPFKDFKPMNFNSAFNLSLLGNPAMSITQTPLGSQLSNPTSPLHFQQQLAMKSFGKFPRPMIPSKSPQLPGQNPLQQGGLPAINEGILMRMMREPLQGGGSKSVGGVSPNPGFFDLGASDPNLHVAGLRKQKRYVQCTSCSKVLSSLSALKRHMEDVHCARIQGKCLLCGRVYSSRNSLLTHVYSAHKKHHDYKAVARIIRESDFEQFATA